MEGTDFAHVMLQYLKWTGLIIKQKSTVVRLDCVLPSTRRGMCLYRFHLPDYLGFAQQLFFCFYFQQNIQNHHSSVCLRIWVKRNKTSLFSTAKYYLLTVNCLVKKTTEVLMLQNSASWNRMFDVCATCTFSMTKIKVNALSVSPSQRKVRGALLQEYLDPN